MVLALHGFWGCGADWDFLKLDDAVVAPSLFCPESYAKNQVQESAFLDWLPQVDRQISAAPRKILVGYSLGGRLALHALLRSRYKFDAAIFISTHFGLEDEKQRQQRYLDDMAWSERFLTQEWSSLLKDWNQQGVLSSSLAVRRGQDQFSRQALAQALLCYSLGKQECFLSELNNLQVPCLWVVGERDQKFLDLSKQIQNPHGQFRKRIVPNSGHRVLWDQPHVLLREIQEFIQEVAQ